MSCRRFNTPLRSMIFFFVQINFFNVFMYAYISDNDKQESKVLSNLLKITMNTVLYVSACSWADVPISEEMCVILEVHLAVLYTLVSAISHLQKTLCCYFFSNIALCSSSVQVYTVV